MSRLRIAILCYASVGGSGVVATELAHALAARDHEVYVLSRERPFRWRSDVRGLSFVQVQMPDYPLFREPQYLLGLTNSIVRLARSQPIDIVHEHYAVPHASAAHLAREMLSRGPHARPPRTVATLHGTDITLVGSDPSYEAVVGFAIEQTNVVTAVSASLRDDTIRSLGITRDIRVIPNFLDCAEWQRRPDPELRARIRGPYPNANVLIHVSNFRPVKRVGIVVEVFRRVLERKDAVLVMVGDGPDRAPLEREVDALGLQGRVQFVGEQHDLVPWLSSADVFLLPSAQESFGLAALEAMACEVAVVASRVGGLPEVIEDGKTGFLCPPDAIDLMAARVVDLLSDAALRQRIGCASAERVCTTFCTSTVVPLYEECYRAALD
ncbi:MAG TPA: N-acetyl-alpha-D-glucosaminyl L-malate synthase BshA [Vicinamibacterales bacterium]|nr:N-acetyl-alpha-D-glucosaminyl L-malate synthase BshA [Vicinamibacterales bacterium]